MELVNAPVPVGTPCAVLVVNAIVGLSPVPQTTPYWLGSGIPREVIFPFPVAVMVEILVTACVVTVGVSKVVKVTSSP